MNLNTIGTWVAPIISTFHGCPLFWRVNSNDDFCKIVTTYVRLRLSKFQLPTVWCTYFYHDELIDWLTSKKHSGSKRLRSHRVPWWRRRRPLPKRSQMQTRGTSARRWLCNLPAIQRLHVSNFQSQLVSPRQRCDSGSAYTNKKRIQKSIIAYLQKLPFLLCSTNKTRNLLKLKVASLQTTEDELWGLWWILGSFSWYLLATANPIQKP